MKFGDHVFIDVGGELYVDGKHIGRVIALAATDTGAVQVSDYLSDSTASSPTFLLTAPDPGPLLPYVKQKRPKQYWKSELERRCKR